MEKILQENPNRFVLMDGGKIQYPDIWEMYKDAQASFWTAEEVDLEYDKFDELTPDEQHYLKHVLAFFAASDGIVNENLAINFLQEVQIPEARCYYGFQIMIENIHSEVYSLLIDRYISDTTEKRRLFSAIQTIPSIKKKAEWALKWIESPHFVDRLIAFAAVEGIFFSSSFAAIYWLGARQLMPGLKFANELISRDEGMHRDFAILLYNNYITDKKDPEHIKSILLEAYEIEKEFVLDSLPVRLIGMNSDLMVQYLQYTTDVLLDNLNIEKHFKVKQPLKFMEQLGLQGKTNFFEKRVGDYRKANVGTTVSKSKDLFDEDF